MQTPYNLGKSMRKLSLSVISVLMCLSLSCSKKPVEPANQPPLVPEIDAASGAPGSNAVDQPVSLMLLWTCSDPEGDTLTYDI